jgi:glycogen synthase
MPEDMSFADIRQGSDLEFGQSIYEPFGIAQVEPLSFGALCVVSSICGCVGFLERIGGLGKRNVIVADYTAAGSHVTDIETSLSIDQACRDEIEQLQARAVAAEIFDRLPRNAVQAQEVLAQGHQLSQDMSWETIARHYLLPGLQRAWQRQT